jgi:hypothetical protein
MHDPVVDHSHQVRSYESLCYGGRQKSDDMNFRAELTEAKAKDLGMRKIQENVRVPRYPKG